MVILAVLDIASGRAGAQPASGGPPVVDRSSVLTEDERAFLGAAVAEVRRRTDFAATVVVVRSARGRSGQEIAESLSGGDFPDDQVPTALVLVADPPSAEVVTPAAVLERFGYEPAIAGVERDVRAALRSDGLPQAGLAFTAGLTDARPDRGSTPGWGPIVAVFGGLVVAALALRALVAHRRVRRVPADAGAIAEVDGDEALVQGQIVSEGWLSIGTSPQLVWFERSDSQYQRHLQRWEDGAGRQWYEQTGGHWNTKKSEDGVPFAISDGSGYAWVDPRRATVEGRKVDSSGWFSGDTQHTTYGIPWGSEVSVGGPCRRDPDGSLVFEPAGGGAVMISHRPARKARRTFRGRQVRAVVQLAVVVMVYAGALAALGG